MVRFARVHVSCATVLLERPRFRARNHAILSYGWAVFAGLLLLCAILLPIDNVLGIGFLFEKNYNEGWNVYNTERLLNGELIYDANCWRVNNYPIGSFLIVGAVDFLIHDALWSGRIAAMVSFAAIGVLATAATRGLGGRRVDAAFGAGCAVGFCYLIAPAWIMADDPQTLGEAVMLGGLVNHLSRPRTRASLLVSAFMIVLGGFIKHNLAAIPIAITLDLAIHSPRLLPFWLFCCAGWVAGFFALTELVAGGAFIEHLLSPRIFTWHGARYHLMKYIRLFKFPLAAIALCSPLVFLGHRIVLAAWGIASILLSTIFSGFEGASYNLFQDAAVFLGVAAGLTFCELRKRAATSSGIGGRAAKLVSGALTVALAQPILARSPDAMIEAIDARAQLASDRKAEEVFQADAKYISDTHGPAICESLLLCHTAGQPFILDPFNSRQYLLAGKLSEGELIRRITAREFAVIQLRAEICDDPATRTCHILHYPQKVDRFTDDVLYAIDRYYRVERHSPNGAFYVPR